VKYRYLLVPLAAPKKHGICPFVVLLPGAVLPPPTNTPNDPPNYPPTQGPTTHPPNTHPTTSETHYHGTIRPNYITIRQSRTRAPAEPSSDSPSFAELELGESGPHLTTQPIRGEFNSPSSPSRLGYERATAPPPSDHWPIAPLKKVLASLLSCMASPPHQNHSFRGWGGGTWD
jgi:hypothetical protein